MDGRGRPRKYIRGHNKRRERPRGVSGKIVVFGPRGSSELQAAFMQNGKDLIEDRLGQYLSLEDGRYWTEEKIKREIQSWVKRHGLPPTSAEWSVPADRPNFFRGEVGRRPTSSTVQRVFGSWNAAIRAAGYEPRYESGQNDGCTPESKARRGLEALHRKHCRRGHDLTIHGARVQGRGNSLRCRVCHAAIARRSAARRKAANGDTERRPRAARGEDPPAR